MFAAPNPIVKQLFCRYGLSTEQSVPSGFPTKILFDTKLYEIGDNFDIENNRLIVPKKSRICFIGCLGLEALTVLSYAQIIVYINGAAYGALDTHIVQAADTTDPQLTVVLIDEFGKNDYIELFMVHFDPPSKIVKSDNKQTTFTAIKLF